MPKYTVTVLEETEYEVYGEDMMKALAEAHKKGKPIKIELAHTPEGEKFDSEPDTIYPNSTWVNQIVYKDNGRLEIFTHDGKEMVYLDVPKVIFNGFETAESAGRYYNEHVKNKFEYLGDWQ